MEFDPNQTCVQPGAVDISGWWHCLAIWRMWLHCDLTTRYGITERKSFQQQTVISTSTYGLLQSIIGKPTSLSLNSTFLESRKCFLSKMFKLFQKAQKIHIPMFSPWCWRGNMKVYKWQAGVCWQDVGTSCICNNVRVYTMLGIIKHFQVLLPQLYHCILSTRLLQHAGNSALYISLP